MIQISLTALSGDPDVYISTGSDELPGPTNFDWVGGSIGKLFLVLLREHVVHSTQVVRRPAGQLFQP